MKEIENIQEYHQRTKHHPDRYARSLGYMDWKNQPNPFRFFEGAERVNLPLQDGAMDQPYDLMFGSQAIEPRPFALPSIATFLELSLGLSAWKQYGASEWSLRMNPSSGNLHPTECYLLLPKCDDTPCCIAHYNPLLHCLEIRHEFDDAASDSFNRADGFGVVLSSIYWREAWKYGERAYRYTQHDVGHALGALRFSAALLGWGLDIRPEVSDESLDRLLGFHDKRQVPGETERADCFCWVSIMKSSGFDEVEWLSSLQKPEYADTPNRLSAAVVDWPVIEQAARICESPGYQRRQPEQYGTVIRTKSAHSAADIIRQRRSAQTFGPESSSMEIDSFRQILTATLPAGGAPFDLLATPTNIHLFLFVHRVDGIEPGLYCLMRNARDLAALRTSCSERFLWEQVEQGLPLYLLQAGDNRARAETICCHQAIAGDSAFSLGMLARFGSVMSAPWLYPNLFWEAGLIGQVLYLEAEEKGFRGTGIGCYFDDLMHERLGLHGQEWQDIYHFTVGVPLEDQRLRSYPPYHHLAKLRGSFDE